MKKLNKTKNEKTIYSGLQIPVEAYLFFPKLTKLEQKGDFTRFFEQLMDSELDDYLKENEVFLNKHSALLHNRFLQKNLMVLKVYLPHTAILGHSNGLILKKGFISKSHVHGCYPNLQTKNFYLENPFFDEKHYPPFVHSHQEMVC